MNFYPRNINDALIRAGMDPNAKVHLHIEEVERDLAGLKAQWQAEALEEVGHDFKVGTLTKDFILRRAAELRRQAEGDHDR